MGGAKGLGGVVDCGGVIGCWRSCVSFTDLTDIWPYPVMMMEKGKKGAGITDAIAGRQDLAFQDGAG